MNVGSGATPGRGTASAGSAVAGRSFVLRYWLALRQYSERHLVEEFSLDPAVFLWTTAIVAAALVGLLHLLQAVTVRHGTLVALLGLVPSIATAGLALALLVWLYWRIRLDASQLEPYLLALLASAVTIGVCTEAFAGVTTFLWRHDTVGLHSTIQPSLWTSEQYYIWHLLDSVPLLSIPRTLRWTESAVFLDRGSGSLLLAYKVLLIVPLLRIAFSGYQSLGNLWLSKRDRDSVRDRRWRGALRPPRLDPTAIMSRWLNPRVSQGVTLLGHHLSLSWARTAPQWAALVVLVWGMSGVAEDLELGRLVYARSLRAVGIACATFVSLIAIATMAFTAATVVLLQVGWGIARPAIPPGSEVSAAISAYIWHALDAIPGLNIPATLNWSLRYDLVDYWDGALLVAYKAVFFGILVIPIAWAVRAFSRRVRRPSAPVAIRAAREFRELLGECSAQLDRAEGVVLKRRDARPTSRPPAGDKTRPRTYPTTGEKRELVQRELVPGSRAMGAAEASVDALEDALQRIRALFGESQVGERAEAALEAAARRLVAIERAWKAWGLDRMLSTGWAKEMEKERKELARQLGESKLAASRSAEEYVTSALSAFSDAAPAEWTHPSTPHP
jgi:hypothetical protein